MYAIMRGYVKYVGRKREVKALEKQMPLRTIPPNNYLFMEETEARVTESYVTDGEETEAE